jgi:hypothetical protein
MKRKLLTALTATILAALLAWNFWPAGRPAAGPDAGHAVGGTHGTTGPGDVGPGKGGRGEVGAPQPGGAAGASADHAGGEDLVLREQEIRIAKLRKLNESVDGGSYRAADLAAALSSDEGMWLKAAYLQGALDSRWAGAEADKALAEALGFLADLDPGTNPNAMAVRAYHTSMQLMADLNRRGGGRYDGALKERYEKTGNPDYLKTISDAPYKLGKIPSVPPRHAVAIVRESPSPEYVEYARGLLTSRAITAEDRGDLNKYLAQHGGKSEWGASPAADRGTRLMKLNGVAASDAGGKVEYIYGQWRDIFFAKITDDMSYPDWRALPNPTHELAQALWTEGDQGARKKVEGEILRLLKRHHVGGMGDEDQRKQRALVNLAVAYLDLCLSNLVPRECRDELANRRSFGAEVARDHLAAYMGRPDASMALGTAKAYVEKVAGDSGKK